MPFFPGLVGGHCIGVDPYYLTHCAVRAGYHPEIILAGRRINDATGIRVARECIRLLMKSGKARTGRVTVLGLTFKENVPDIRNSRIIDVIHELAEFGVQVQVADPLASAEEVLRDHGIRLTALDQVEPADAVVLAVPHDRFLAGGWKLATQLLAGGEGLVLDVKSKLDRATRPPKIQLWRM